MCMAHLNEGVVQNEHDTSNPPDCSGIPVKHLTNIGNITNLGMAKTEFPVYYEHLGFNEDGARHTKEPETCTKQWQR